MGLNSNNDTKKLRYQHVLIASDYDDDGFHIKGLLIALFFTYWPHLIDQGYLQEFRTPIISAEF